MTAIPWERGRPRPLRLSTVALLSMFIGLVSLPALAAPCPGDCNNDRAVSVDELVRSVNIALGNSEVATCTAVDANNDALVTVDELVRAVNRALEGCPQCDEFNPERNLYFGDLHVHTTLSFDVNVFGVDTTPAQAYRFAQGDPVLLPPVDANGVGTRELRIDRPLDFVAVTDHSEFLGEVEACTTPGSPGHDAPFCVEYRAGTTQAIRNFGTMLTFPQPRNVPICGQGGTSCLNLASGVWQRIQEAATAANDSSAQCRFTSFLAYEYSGAPGISTMHRNVIFRNAVAPFPGSYFEFPTPEELWGYLKDECLDAGTGCDVLAIPHNSNESNGKMFLPEYPGAMSVEEERAQARFRASIEPLVEIFQHKGDSECMNGLSGILGEPDELCDFEKRRRPPFEDCGDGIGQFGIVNAGCISRNDFVRGALLTGLKEEARLGVNPFQLGILASTDTHNGSPGAVQESTFVGQRGLEDDTPEKQLGRGMLQPGGIIFNPGGLAAVWAEENSRNSIFQALRRRETFGTSGPRIAVRLFGGWELNQPLCGDPRMVEKGYQLGVPMGGVLPTRPQGDRAPSFVVSALRDPGTPARPDIGIQRIQIIKGWVTGGESHQKVFEVAGNPDNGAGVNLDTCLPIGIGFNSLCSVWTDPEFDPAQHAFYYARVVENPSCRWSTYTCNRLAPAERPAACSDPNVAKTIQERAWTSPIWYRPS